MSGPQAAGRTKALIYPLMVGDGCEGVPYIDTAFMSDAFAANMAVSARRMR